MFFHGNLIIGYIHEPEKNIYAFQVTGGEECPVGESEFYARWQEYCDYVAKHAVEEEVLRDKPLPITMTVRRSVKRNAVDLNKRRTRKLA